MELEACLLPLKGFVTGPWLCGRGLFSGVEVGAHPFGRPGVEEIIAAVFLPRIVMEDDGHALAVLAVQFGSFPAARPGFEEVEATGFFAGIVAEDDRHALAVYPAVHHGFAP